MSRTRIKVCGLRTAEDARAAAEAGADAVGFVFVESSPRVITPDDAAEIMMRLPPLVTAVGVVQDLSVDEFADLEERCPCPMMQLHGKESEKTVAACGPGVIKAIRYRPGFVQADFKRWDAVEEVDAVLIDSPEPGSGQTIDWDEVAAAKATLGKPLILAGGLNPDNAAEAVRKTRPYAVDVSSGVERERGAKDHRLIEQFCNAVASAG